MHSKSDNFEVMAYGNPDEIIEELLIIICNNCNNNCNKTCNNFQLFILGEINGNYCRPMTSIIVTS